MNRARRVPRARGADPADPTAGPAACDVARADARETERVCERALAVSSRCSWAAVRLAPIAARRGPRSRRGALRTTLRGGDADAPAAAAAWEALGASYDAMDKHSAALKAYRKAMDVESSDLRLGSATRVYVRRGRGGSSSRRRATWTPPSPPPPPRSPPRPATRRRRSPAEAETARAKDAARRGALARAASAAARAAAAAETARPPGRTRRSAPPRSARATGAPVAAHLGATEPRRRLSARGAARVRARARAGDAAPRRGVVRPRRGVRRFRRRAGAGGERVRALRAFRERLSCLLARRARVAVPSRVSAPGPREPGGVGRARDAPSGGRRRERRVFFTEERRARRERREARRLGAAPARPRATRDGTRARHTPGPLERARVGGARACVRRRRA